MVSVKQKPSDAGCCHWQGLNLPLYILTTITVQNRQDKMPDEIQKQHILGTYQEILTQSCSEAYRAVNFAVVYAY